MAEYIKLEPLRDEILNDDFDCDIVNHFLGIVDSQPTADVVEVVRCKDCSHCIVNEKHPDKPLICCRTKMCGTTKPEWFCADGEKKEYDIYQKLKSLLEEGAEE